MSRKVITKVLIFQYLNARQVQVSADFSKQVLLEKVLELWEAKFSDNESAETVPCTVGNELSSQEDQFPIHQMSRQFSAWFFKMCNENQLKIEDFWADAQYTIQMVECSQMVNEESGNGSQAIVELMQNLHTQQNLLFNPNDCHDGVQGRMDPHGLVMVLCCGTLHSPGQFVGVFECMFGLLRDPFADGNWKIKLLRLRLNSSSPREAPRLAESTYLESMLSLPAPLNMDL